jgi:hypothetical protein
MVKRQAAVGRVVEQRVVDRARALGIDLVDPRDEPHLVLPRDLAQAVAGRAGHRDGLAREERERLLGAGLRPAGERLRPGGRRVDGDEGLREDDELCPVRGRGRCRRRELVERALAVQHDRLDLTARHAHRAPHAEQSSSR